jgi:simple sugar transport system permease protein
VNQSLVSVVRALAFVLVALILCSIVFEFAGYSAVEMFQSIAEGAFLSGQALMNTLRWTLPLFLSASGVLISFRCGYFNIGAQGQFYMGAIAAAAVADWCNGLTPWIMIPLMIVAGMVGGGVWALWPGWLRVRSGTDEVITTLMGNFIGNLFLIYVTSGPLKDQGGSGEMTASKPIAAMYRLSDSSGVSAPLISIVIAVGIVTWVLVNRTAFGVVGSLAGRNPVMVTWQGARMARVGLAAFVFSGAMAGLAGTMELMGPAGRLLSGFSPSHGFTAVLIALVAGLSATGTGIVALFFGGLAAASLYLPVIAGLPAAAIDMINAAIALFITARRWPRLGALFHFTRAASPAGGNGGAR